MIGIRTLKYIFGDNCSVYHRHLGLKSQWELRTWGREKWTLQSTHSKRFTTRTFYSAPFHWFHVFNTWRAPPMSWALCCPQEPVVQSGVFIQHLLCKCQGGNHANKGQSLPLGTLLILHCGQTVVGTMGVGSDWDFWAELWEKKGGRGTF